MKFGSGILGVEPPPHPLYESGVRAATPKEPVNVQLSSRQLTADA